MSQKTIIGVYTRVSTQEQAREGYSIDEQKDRLTKYCEAHDWIIKDIYTDPGFSGGSMERPGLKRLIVDVTAGSIDKVLVYKLDRLSRSQKDTLYLIEDVFIANGVDFVSMTENFDTSTPLGRAMIGILSVFAQLEREQIKERMSMGREGRAKSGLYSGNDHIITGYNYVDGKLEIDPYYADIVRRIFKEFNEGRSLKAIAKDLNNDGLRTSTGCKWIGSNLGTILRHSEYVGKIIFRGIEYDGIQEPIIDPDTWERAQQRLEYRRQNDENYHRFYEKTSIITGLCYCEHCKSKKRIEVAQEKHADGSPKKYVACRNKKEKGCPDKRVPVWIVEDYILSQIKKLSLDPKYLQECRTTSDNGTSLDRIQILTDHIKDNERKIQRLADLYTIDGIDLSHLKDQIETLTGEITGNKAEIARLKENIHEEKSEAEILKIVSSLEKYTEDPEKLRIIVGILIKRIDFNGNQITIRWNF